MDPLAQRFLWSQLRGVRESGSAIVLTSHSMEECEELCTRLTIMVDGQLQCIGSPQHLRTTYGKGYMLVVLAELGRNNDVKRFVLGTFEGSTLNEEHKLRLQFTLLGLDSATLPAAFGDIERNTATAGIASYHITQTTLEAVFCRIAKTYAANANVGAETDVGGPAETRVYVDNPSYAEDAEDDIPLLGASDL